MKLAGKIFFLFQSLILILWQYGRFISYREKYWVDNFSIIGVFVPGDEGKCSFHHFCNILAHFQPTKENTPDSMPNSAVSKIRLGQFQFWHHIWLDLICSFFGELGFYRSNIKMVIEHWSIWNWKQFSSFLICQIMEQSQSKKFSRYSDSCWATILIPRI